MARSSKSLHTNSLLCCERSSNSLHTISPHSKLLLPLHPERQISTRKFIVFVSKGVQTSFQTIHCFRKHCCRCSQEVESTTPEFTALLRSEFEDIGHQFAALLQMKLELAGTKFIALEDFAPAAARTRNECARSHCTASTGARKRCTRIRRTRKH